ncbi:MAG: CRISPR-associated endonuclease Cas2 [Planctomycetota bacterium]|nr:MAG: CRISPR-associated endonuclease Cas2 [Planctomycetota bacterium]RLT00538.1 MAG: CRISPR-associated endonuclease Cas2 [Planctomycetota bacterium]
MRRSFLVCYDIRDPKRLRKVHRFVKAYGEGWQYSVFYCTLKSIDRVRLENGLREIVNLKEDQILIVDLGSNEEAARGASTFMGLGVPKQESGMLVI